MRGQVIVAGLIGWMAISAAVAADTTHHSATETESRAADAEATPSLVREIQFMLLRLGMEPGSIDGIVGPLTTNAVHQFQQRYGLPATELVNDGRVSAQLLTRIRSEAARAILGNAKPEVAPTPAAPPAATPLPAAPAPAAPKPAVAVVPPQPLPPPNRFAACPYDPADFRIGGTQYTPDKFLQDGFEGSTTRAVASLKDRLTEARQLAENIGGSALAEVQRQARVLAYFSCRLKIEQASGSK